MKNMYTRVFGRWLFILFLLGSQTLLAQTAPVIQWQKFTGGIIKQATNGDIILGSGQTISRLNQATGQLIWTTSLPAGFDATIVYDLLVSRDGSIVALLKDRANYYLAKLDASGTVLSNKPFAGATQSGDLVQTTIKSIAQAADGGYVALSSSTYGRNGAGTVLYKFDASGSNTSSSGVSYPYSNTIRPVSFGNKVISTPDGGYLVVGATNNGAEASSLGWAAKLDQNLKQVWTDRYNFASNFTDVIQNPFDAESFIATGQSADFKATITLVISPTQPSTNNTAGTYRPSLRSAVLVYSISDMSNISIEPQITTTGSSSYEVMDAVDQRSGDIRIVSFGPNNQMRWTKILGGSFADVPRNIITTATDNLLLTGLTSSSDGDVQGKTGGNVSGWLVKLAPSTPLVLNQPTYNCSTGAITFNTTGGDGSPITFSAPGIMRSSATSNTGIVEQGLRNDPKTIIIIATQNGQRAPYSFDLKAFCNGTTPTPDPTPTPTPTGGSLTLTQPTYDCSTGAITFNTTGGTGSTITYTAPGIMRSSITSNTGTVEQGLRNDPKTITITAMQSGQTTTYNFDLKAFCNGTTPTTPTTPPTTGGTLTLTQPTYDCSTGAITFNTTGGDGSTVSYTAPGIARSSVTSSTGVVEQGLRNDPKTITITAMQSGQTATYSFDLKAFCNGITPTPSSTLKLLAPVVDCASRQVTLVTSGGDGSAISFNTPTITRSSATSPTGTVDFCVGAKPPVLQATQSGYTATYESFDFVKLCPAYLGVKPLTVSQIPDINVPLGQYTRLTLGDYFKAETNTVNRYAPLFSFHHSGAPTGSSIDDQSSVVRSQQPYAFFFLNTLASGVYTITVTGKNECDPAVSSTFKLIVNPASGVSALTLTQPTYDCATGAFTFNYTGGNGSPIEFQAAGITGWTTTRNQFVDKDSRTANDVKPFTLMARQNGQVVTYSWDLKAACGRSARMAAVEAEQALELTVKGNPVANTAVVEIRGAEGQAVSLDLLNASGHVLEQRHIEQAGAVDEQRFDVQRQPTGLLFLRAQSGQQKQTVKLIKQ